MSGNLTTISYDSFVFTPVTPPGVPTSVTATAGNTSASVAFTALASNGGRTVTGYTVTSSPGGIEAQGGEDES